MKRHSVLRRVADHPYPDGMTDTVHVLEWASPPDAATATPPTTAHRTPAGARAAIASVAAGLGISPAEVVETVRPSGRVEGQVGPLFYMLRALPLTD